MFLVTGGAGFIGSNIASALAKRGDDVVVCDWLGSGGKWQNLSNTRLRDFVFPEDLKSWLQDHASRVTAIIHMGAISSTTESNADLIAKNNIRLTFDLWEFACKQKLPLLYASSAATYGGGERGFDDNEAPEQLAALRPLNAYGWSKHIVDQRFVNDTHKGNARPPQWAGLKFFNVYGPNESHKDSMRSVVHKIFPAISSGDEIDLFKSHDARYEDGGQLRDFVYVRDCVKVIIWLLENPRVTGLFNVGTGRARSFHDLAIAVGTACKSDVRIRYIDMPSDIRPRYQYFTQANISKLRRAGYSSDFTTLEDGIRDYVQNYLNAAKELSEGSA